MVWGLLQALYLNVEALLPRCSQSSVDLSSRFAALCVGLFARLWTFALCCFSWVFFRANSMGDALYILRHSITGGKAPIQYVKAALQTLYPGTVLTAVLLFSLGLLFLFDLANERGDAIEALSIRPVYIRWTVYVVFLLLLFLLIPKEGTVPIVYFQF